MLASCVVQFPCKRMRIGTEGYEKGVLQIESRGLELRQYTRSWNLTLDLPFGAASGGKTKFGGKPGIVSVGWNSKQSLRSSLSLRMDVYWLVMAILYFAQSVARQGESYYLFVIEGTGCALLCMRAARGPHGVFSDVWRCREKMLSHIVGKVQKRREDALGSFPST